MAIPLQGATFELRDTGGNLLSTATSDAAGIVALGSLSPGTYTLTETVTPEGFLAGGSYTVVVAANGDITIDGIPLADFTAENLPFPNFTFAKTDTLGNPLQGGVFSLDDLTGTIQYATSTVDGTVSFFGVRPGEYVLAEETPPFGFVPDPTVYFVQVTEDGTVTVGGNDPAGFTVINQEGVSLSFIKLNASPDSLTPILDPVRSGLIPVTGTGVPGSVITVTWPNAATTNVPVALNNTWTAVPPVPLLVGQSVSVIQTTPNHLPSASASQIVQQASDPPGIDAVLVGDALLNGTGVSGSLTTVMWPDGTTGDVTVGGGTWSLAPPAPFALGEEIVATQTTPGMLPSLPASITVQQVSAAPGINAVDAGDPNIIGTGIAGSSIAIDWPVGAPGSTTVGAYGTWLAMPPEALISGQVISATQTTPGMLVSPATTTTVI